MAQSETQFLRPCKASVPENDWPVFVLTDAEVRDGKTGELRSVLTADGKRPLTMVGTLSKPEPRYRHCLLSTRFDSPVVEVTNITRYAFGQYDDEGLGVWARGRSGWFEVQKPTRKYSKIHRETTEAVEILYFSQDQYRAGNMSIGHKEIFQKYAKSHPVKLHDWKAAAQVFHKHREFLAKEMRKNGRGEADGLRWKETPLYEYMVQQFPELFPSSRPPSKAGSIRSERLGSVKDSSASVTQRPATRLRSIDGAVPNGEIPDNMSTTSSRKRDFTPTGPGMEELEKRAKALWKFVLDTYKRLSSDPDDLTLEMFATELHIWYIFEDVSQASDYMSALAPQLHVLMDRSRMCNWSETEIYQALQTTKLPAVTRKRVLLLSLEARTLEDAERCRKLHAGEELDEEQSSDASSNASSPRPKSALRPKGGKSADKGAKTRGKRPLEDDGDGVDDGDLTMEDVGSPTNRKAEEVRRPGRPRKRKAGDTFGTTGFIGEAGSDEDGSEAGDAIELPLRRKIETQKPPAALNGTSHSRRDQTVQHSRSTRSHPRPRSPEAVPPLVTEELPSEEPNGPVSTNTWTCTEDGCTQKIYGATKALGKRLIREHIKEHEEQHEAETQQAPQSAPIAVSIHEGALDLIRAEEEMCNLPVSNLIKRIRDLSALNEGPPAFPAPIMRRY